MSPQDKTRRASASPRLAAESVMRSACDVVGSDPQIRVEHPVVRQDVAYHATYAPPKSSRRGPSALGSTDKPELVKA